MADKQPRKKKTKEAEKRTFVPRMPSWFTKEGLIGIHGWFGKGTAERPTFRYGVEAHLLFLATVWIIPTVITDSFKLRFGETVPGFVIYYLSIPLAMYAFGHASDGNEFMQKWTNGIIIGIVLFIPFYFPLGMILKAYGMGPFT